MIMENESSYIKVKIDNITLSNLGFIVFLRQEDDKENILPICIGAMEAHSIAAAFNNQPFPRPLSHDLFKDILGNLHCNVTRIYITNLLDGTFYARVLLQTNNKEYIDVDARPSDAIALSLRFKTPIFVHQEVLATASVHVSQTKEKPKKKSAPTRTLQEKLDDAVKKEDYEKAAKIRDQLQEIKNKNEKN